MINDKLLFSISEGLYLDLQTFDFSIIKSKIKPTKNIYLGSLFKDLYFWNENLDRDKPMRKLYATFLLNKLLINEGLLEHSETLDKYLRQKILIMDLLRVLNSLSSLSDNLGFEGLTKKLKTIYLDLKTSKEPSLFLYKSLKLILNKFKDKFLKSKFYFSKYSNSFKIDKLQALSLGFTGVPFFASGLWYKNYKGLLIKARERGSFYDRVYVLVELGFEILDKLYSFETSTKNFDIVDLYTDYNAKLSTLKSDKYTVWDDLGSGIFSMELKFNGKKLNYRLLSPSDRNIIALTLFNEKDFLTVSPSISIFYEDLANFKELSKSFSLHGFSMEL